MNESGRIDAERLTALLRIVAVPVLLVGEAYVPKPEPTEGWFLVVLAVVRAVRGRARSCSRIGSRRPARTGRASWSRRHRLRRARSLTALAAASPSCASRSFPGRRRRRSAAGRWLTASVAVTCTAVYVLQAAPHPSRSDAGDTLVRRSCRRPTWPGSASRWPSSPCCWRGASPPCGCSRRSGSAWSRRRSPQRSASASSWRRTCTTARSRTCSRRATTSMAGRGGSRRPRGARPCGHHGHGPELRGARRRPPPVPARAGRARSAAIAQNAAPGGRARRPRARPRPGRRRAGAERSRRAALRQRAARERRAPRARATRVASSCGAARGGPRAASSTTAWASIRCGSPAPCAPGHIGLALAARARRGPGRRAHARERARRGNRRHGDDPAELLLTRVAVPAPHTLT